MRVQSIKKNFNGCIAMNLMTPVWRSPIEQVSAWKACNFKSAASVTLKLKDAQLNVIDLYLKDRDPRDKYPSEGRLFGHPVLQPLAADVRKQIMSGLGIVILSGLTRDRYSEEKLVQIYWELGLHLGIAAVQSVNGDRLGHVQMTPDNPNNRGYLADRELGLHSDAYEIVGLLCLQNAAKGGENVVSSALAIHNEIWEKRPELLDILYAGFPYAIAEAKNGHQKVTQYKIPVFSCVRGMVSCMCGGAYVRDAATILGEPLPEELLEAYEYLLTIGNDADFSLRFTLKPGEILLLNNFVTVHARTAFSDSFTKRRHLVRLWLRVANGRPVIPELLRRGETYEKLYAQQML